MEDEELARIRAQRMAQLRNQAGNSSTQKRPEVTGNQGDSGDAEKQQKAKEREAELRNSILSTVLSQEARARLSTLAAAKPDRAKLVENIIIQNAQMGVIRGRVDENQLKDLLQQVTASASRETSVKYERRRAFDDDDDDDDNDDDYRKPSKGKDSDDSSDE